MEKKFVHFESIKEDRIHETGSFPYMETGCVNVTRERFGNRRILWRECMKKE